MAESNLSQEYPAPGLILVVAERTDAVGTLSSEVFINLHRDSS